MKPTSGATQVPLSSTIQITFSSAADSSTINATDIAVTNPKPVAGALSYDSSTDSVTFTPAAALAANSTYTVTVSGVKSASGVAMASPFQAKFVTVMPPPPAGGGGGGGTGGGGAATPTTQYEAPLTPEIGLGTIFNGQVTVDTAGNTAIKLTGATASTTYTVQFCTGIDSGDFSNIAPNCFTITTITTDASGNVSSTVKFPKPGNWAGDFTVDNSAGKIMYQTFLATDSSNQTYMATLLPDTTTNGGTVTALTTQGPLKSGTVALKNGALQFTIQGASPNTTYFTNVSETVYMDSSGTYQMTTFTTDASGNGASTASLNDGNGGDLFQVGPDEMRPTTAGYIGGFAIPQ